MAKLKVKLDVSGHVNNVYADVTDLQRRVHLMYDKNPTAEIGEMRDALRRVVAGVATLPNEILPQPKEDIVKVRSTGDNVRQLERLVAKAPPSAKPVIDILRYNIQQMLQMQATKDGAFTSRDEIKQILRTFYQLQRMRIMANNRSKALVRDGKPNSYMDELTQSFEAQEDSVRLIMEQYNKNHELYPWISSVKGIGPILTAGFISVFDIERAATAGHFWSYAGIIPGKERVAGQKITYQPLAKVLCFKAALSFAMTSVGEKPSFYGQQYKLRKMWEIKGNSPENHMEYTREILRKRNFSEDTELAETFSAARKQFTLAFPEEECRSWTAKQCYEHGIFPPAHLEMRAKRWVAKLFLAHVFEEWYKVHWNKEPPIPYAQAFLDHVHIINAPLKEYDPKGIYKANQPIYDARGKVIKR